MHRQFNADSYQTRVKSSFACHRTSLHEWKRTEEAAFQADCTSRAISENPFFISIERPLTSEDYFQVCYVNVVTDYEKKKTKFDPDRIVAVMRRRRDFRDRARLRRERTGKKATLVTSILI